MDGAIIPSAGAQLTTSGRLDYRLFAEWEKFIDASPRTVEAYTANVRRFADYLSAQGITAPTRDTVLAYKQHLQATYKATTVSAYLAAVRVFFQWTDTLPPPQHYPNIAAHVKGAKISREHKRDDLTAGECAAVLRGIDRSTEQGARDYAILAVMITCGLRDIEISRANVEDVARRGEKVRLYVQGKGREERTDYVNLPKETVAAIRDYMQFRTNAAGRSIEGSAPLFASLAHSNHGGRMTTRAVSGIAKRSLQAAGFDDTRITAHSLRHAAVSNALRGGEDLRAVQMFARHSDIGTTLIYAHDLDRESNTVSDTLARLIFREGGEARNP